jgi:hypothetical protein
MSELRGLRTYIYECLECDDGRFNRTVRYPKRDDQCCKYCNSPLTRRPSGAIMNTRTSRSFVDGTDRGDTYKKCKEAGKIEADSYDLPPEKRGEHNKEIRKLKEVKK